MKPKFPIPVTPFDPLTLDAFEIEAHIFEVHRNGREKNEKTIKNFVQKIQLEPHKHTGKVTHWARKVKTSLNTKYLIGWLMKF